MPQNLDGYALVMELIYKCTNIDQTLVN